MPYKQLCIPINDDTKSVSVTATKKNGKKRKNIFSVCCLCKYTP